MWKKTLNEPRVEEPKPAPAISAENKSNQALIGPSITITGGLAGEEDVIIQGLVEGTINFKNHNVTIGSHGRIKANVFAREICVEGQLEGDLHGEKRVIIRQTGQVRGNILAPRVVMEDGCRFRGSVEMEPSAEMANPEHTKTMSAIPVMANRIAGGKSDKPAPEARQVINKN